MKEEIIDILNLNFYDADGKVLYKGGAERYVIDLAKLIEGLGYKARIIQNANFYFEKEYSGFKVIGIQAKAGWASFDKLSEYYANNFSHSAYSICSPLNIACKFSVKNRSIGINHGVHWDIKSNNLSAHTDDKYKDLFDALKNVDAGICVDTNFINWVRTYDYGLSDKLIYIPNYYDPQQFVHNEKDFSDEEIVILFPRRLIFYRGLNLTLTLVDHILSQYENIIFHFVGQAADHEQEIIKGYLNKYPGKIEFYELEMSDMHKAYKKSQIVLIPTIYAEGTSLSCIEAMATNNAVIATNVGGLPNLIIDGFNGLLINPNDESLIKAVEFLIRDSFERIRLAKNASESVKAFRKEVWEKKWTEVLTNFIDQTGRSN